MGYPYGTHMEFICKNHMGPYGQPIWVPYCNPYGSHIVTHMGPIWVSYVLLVGMVLVIWCNSKLQTLEIANPPYILIMEVQMPETSSMQCVRLCGAVDSMLDHSDVECSNSMGSRFFSFIYIYIYISKL